MNVSKVRPFVYAPETIPVIDPYHEQARNTDGSRRLRLHDSGGHADCCIVGMRSPGTSNATITELSLSVNQYPSLSDRVPRVICGGFAIV